MHGDFPQCHDSSFYLFDFNQLDGLLQEHAGRMLVEDAELQVRILEVGGQDHIFTKSDEFHEYFQSSNFKGTRIVYIPQYDSYDRLTISEPSLRSLIQHFDIFPAFYNILCAFGTSTTEIRDLLGGCYNWKRGSISETCYLVKIAEEHGREDEDEPWSIRQMGVYHRFQADDESHTFILLNPMQSFRKRLREAHKKTDILPSWKDIHNLALSHSVWQWRRYLSYWEAQLSHLIKKAHASQVRNRGVNEKIPVLTVEYSDFQDVQVIHDRMTMARFILSSNMRTCCRHQEGLLDRAAMEVLLNELKSQRSRVDSLLDRARSGAELMQSLISFRGLDALRTSSENSNEMAKLAEQDSRNMVELSRKSQKDAATLKRVTWVSSVYLPAMFVSQFLSMNYLTVNMTASPVSLVFAPELWIFLVLTIILVGITLGGWLCLGLPKGRTWQWRRKPLTKHEV